MTKEELIVFLKDNLSVDTKIIETTDYDDERQYFKVVTQLMLGEEVISESINWSY